MAIAKTKTVYYSVPRIKSKRALSSLSLITPLSYLLWLYPLLFSFSIWRLTVVVGWVRRHIIFSRMAARCSLPHSEWVCFHYDSPFQHGSEVCSNRTLIHPTVTAPSEKQDARALPSHCHLHSLCLITSMTVCLVP